MAAGPEARSGTRPGLAAPVLASKITTPALPAWLIPRPRLTERIAGGTELPLTVLTGPPGAGKTTALASWAAAVPGRVAWVTLDEYDNRPGIFWSHVAAALGQAGVAVPGGLPVPSRSRAIGRASLVRLVSVLAAQHRPVVLVLDDLHLITDPGLVQELARVLRYARPGLRLIAAARADPLLPLHRYRVAGELTEIRAAELAFTVPEAAQLMAQHAVALPAGTLELITSRVEGWAAGLRLAALSLDNHPDPALFIKNLTAEDNAITSYLVAEVLDAQPAATRDLMLQTSILNQVNADLARELTGNPQAAARLAALARSNAFVEPLGGGWYRYHCLLAALLRLMLRRESPGRIPGLHRRAARWYQQNGSPAQAVAHAVQISDGPLAAQIVIDELAIPDLLEPGSSSLADGLRQMFPPRELPDGTARPPSLLAAAVLRLSDGQDQACADLLDAAERRLDQVPADQEITARLAAALIRATVARRSGDPGTVRSAAAEAWELFGQLPGGLQTRRPLARAHILSARGTAGLWSGDMTAATAAFRAAAAAAPQGSQTQAACCGHLALIEAMHGRLNQAAELAAATTPPAGLPVPSASVALALVHLQRHELAAGQNRLKQAETALRTRPDRLIGALACLAAARGALARNRGAAAADLLQRARHGWSPPPWLDHLVTLTESRAHAAPAALDAPGRAGTEPATAGAPVVTEELSHREREVLRHAASMLSNPEIAGELYISVNTVKTHLASIYRKLGANDRRQAVRRARHLKLI